MKKIFSLILIFICFKSFGQFPVTQSMASATTKLRVNGGLEAVRGLINGVFADTTTANSDHIDFYNGAQIYTRSDRNFWLRDSVLNMWIRMAKFSEVGGTDTHFGNTDLTQTADRTYSGAGFDYILDDLGDWTFQPASGKSFYWAGFGGSSNVRFEAASFFSYTRGSQLRIYADGTQSKLFSPDGNNFINIDNSNVQIEKTTGASDQFIRLGTGLIDIQSENTAGTNFAQIAMSDKIDMLGEKGITAFAKDSLMLTAVHASGGSNPGTLYIDNLPQRDTAFYVMGLEITGYNNSNGNPRYRAVLQDKSLLGGGGSGTVTDVSVVSANGFSGSVATSTTTPAITLSVNSPSFETWYQNYLGGAPFTVGQVGAGASVTLISGSTIPDGFMTGRTMSTGTTSGGMAYHFLDAAGNYSPISFKTTVRYNYGEKIVLPVLSDGTDTYTYYTGFVDEVTSMAGVVDGAYFSYTDGVSSGQWVCHTESNNSVTSTASGITVAAATDYILEISNYNTEVKFYINKVLVATHITNIPSGSTRYTSIGNSIIKSVGTTSRSVVIEWMAYGRRNN